MPASRERDREKQRERERETEGQRERDKERERERTVLPRPWEIETVAQSWTRLAASSVCEELRLGQDSIRIHASELLPGTVDPRMRVVKSTDQPQRPGL